MATISDALAIAREHHGAGRLEVAEEICRRILSVESEHAEALHLIGAIAHQRGDHQRAIECVQQALARDSRQSRFHNTLGEALRALRRGEQAIGCYLQAIAIEPQYAEYYYNLGLALQELGRPAEAIELYRRALERDPDLVEAYVNLGNVYRELARPDAALASYGLALQRNPHVAEAHNNLGSALQDVGRLDEALACYRQAQHLEPNFAAAHSNYLCALRHHPEVSLDRLSEAHAEYDRRYAAPLRAGWQPHPNDRQPERVPRVGFVSPGFLHGPVGSFLLPALQKVDRRQWHVTGYSNSSVADDVTDQFRAACDAWREVSATGDEDLADRIRADQIDVLFDLAGHAPRGRLLVFARKPAPLQITWIDSVGSTGLSAMDYLLADRHLIPVESAAYYAERILRLPDGHVCFAPPPEAPDVAPLPALQCGHVTFGNFNRAAKLHPGVVSLWSRILHRVPSSRLVPKYSGLESRGAAEHYRTLFAAQGLDASRVELQGHSPRAEYYRQYNRIDIALDPFPHNGGLTTCDLLWMGVPVVTCPGETFAGRQSLSHLSTVGLTETIAGDLDQYVEIAVRLASDLPRLAQLRAGLRQRVAGSPLCDGRRFAENLMHLLRQAWREWCRGGSAAG